MSDEQEAVEEEPEVGGWQVVLSVVMTGDPSVLDSDTAQQELTSAMVVMVDNIRRRFPGRIEQASITDFIFGMEARQI